MIPYQLIRARYELAVRAALAPEGVVLHYDNVEEEPIPVTGAVAVRMAGIALSDGARGERVRVKNLSSKRILDGIVSSENTVLVGGGARDSVGQNRL